MTTTRLRFPMTREKTGNRTGPRYYRVPDLTGLDGAAGCAARMVSIAIRKRRAWLRSVEDLNRAVLFGKQDTAWLRLCVELDAHSIREAALWARIFAKSISAEDPRVISEKDHGAALRARLDDHCQRHNASAA